MKASRRRIPRGSAEVFLAILFVLFLISAVQWGVGNSGVYNAQGIYGIQQGFRTNSNATSRPDTDPAVFSFTNDDMIQTQPFSSDWGTSPWLTSDKAVFENMTAARSVNSIHSGDVTNSGLLAHSGNLAGQPGGAGDLTGGGSISHTTDRSGIIGAGSDTVAFAPGLQSDGWERKPPFVGGGLGGVNDRPDLQNGFNGGTAHNITTVPEPSTLLLVCVGLAAGLLVKRSRR